VRLVVDANILVAELLRKRGRSLVAQSQLELFIATRTLEEAWYELEKRAEIIVKKADASKKTVERTLDIATRVVSENIYFAKLYEYQTFEEEARRRIPRDPKDWHTVALALSLNADIWTQD